MTNKYRIALRDNDEHYIEADRFGIRDGCLVMSRSDSDVAAFSALELRYVRLLDDPSLDEAVRALGNDGQTASAFGRGPE